MNPGHEKILETLNDDPVLRFEIMPCELTMCSMVNAR